MVLREDTMKSKGQALSVELTATSLIFIFLLSAIYVSWNNTALSLDERYLETKFLSISNQVAEQLISNQGLPTDWQDNPENATLTGLNKNFQKISRENLLALIAFANNDSPAKKELLNTQGFDYILTVRRQAAIISQAGRPAGHDIIVTRRTIIYENATATLDVGIHSS